MSVYTCQSLSTCMNCTIIIFIILQKHTFTKHLIQSRNFKPLYRKQFFDIEVSKSSISKAMLFLYLIQYRWIVYVNLSWVHSYVSASYAGLKSTLADNCNILANAIPLSLHKQTCDLSVGLGETSTINRSH